MAISSTHHPIAFALGILGNAISFMVYLAPLPTFIRVYRKKSTEAFQSVPYVFALFSATFWVYYGILKRDGLMLITINTAGCIIQTLYTSIHLAYSPTDAKILTARLIMILNVGVFGSVVVLTLLFAHGPQRTMVVGWISSVISITVYAAPLSILRLVIYTRSVEFMPFYLSLFLTVNATVWFAHGLLMKDLFIALPNVLGFIFGMFQMTIYVFYRNAKQVTDPKDVEVTGIERLSSMSSAEVHPVDNRLAYNDTINCAEDDLGCKTHSEMGGIQRNAPTR